MKSKYNKSLEISSYFDVLCLTGIFHAKYFVPKKLRVEFFIILVYIILSNQTFYWIKTFCVKVNQSSAIILNKWNKNCFMVIFIITTRITFKWKLEAWSWTHFYKDKYYVWTWYYMKNLDTADKNCRILFITQWY